MTVIKVNFEKPEDFYLPPYNWRDRIPPYLAALWNGYHPAALETDPLALFEPSTNPVHTGLQSAKLELVDPTVQRRIHLMHIIDPLDKIVFLEGWYYLPLGFNPDTWTELHKTFKEELHVKGAPWIEGPEYEWYQITSGLKDTMFIDGEYKLWSTALYHGWVDNDGDGLNDYQNGDPPYWSTHSNPLTDSPDGVRLGEWFGVRTYVYRDMVNGTYKLWLNTPRTGGWKLQVSLEGIRTLGIDPARIMAATIDTHDVAFIGSGLSLYTHLNATPKTAYYDDVILANEVPTPISPLGWLLPLAFGVGLLWLFGEESKRKRV